jgi:riboflavin synthase
MFGGIIEKTAEVISVSKKETGLRVRIAKPESWKIKLGGSVSIDGVCSTVAALGVKYFEIEYMPETVERSTVPFFKKGTQVNLELPLQLRDFIGGHFIQGHIDTTGDVAEVKKSGNSLVLKINFPGQYRRFIAEKGSIAVNGVSLTVAAIGKNWFSVSLVSYTLEHTNLRNLKKVDKVNLEVDIIARYLDSLLNKNAKKKLR